MSDLTSMNRYTPPGTPTYTRLEVSAGFNQHGVVQGPNVPGWPRLLGKRNLSTPLSGSLLETTSGTIQCQFARQFDIPHVLWENTLAGRHPTKVRLPTAPFDPGLLKHSLEAKLGSKIWNKVNEFQGGVFVGEMRQTLNMLRNPLAGIAQASLRCAQAQNKILNTFKRRRYMSWQTMSRAQRRAEWYGCKASLENVWLQTVYGILPLVGDIESLVARVKRLGGRTKVERVSTEMSDSASAVTTGLSNSAFGWEWDVALADSCSIKLRGTAGIRIVSSEIDGLDTLAENFGLSLSTFVPTLYELMPYSFLIDYFSNVNQLIESLCVEDGSVVWSWCGYEVLLECLEVVASVRYPVDPHGTVHGSYTPWKMSHREVKRWIPDFSSTSVLMGYRLELPSTLQAVNIAALLGAAASSKDLLSEFRSIGARL